MITVLFCIVLHYSSVMGHSEDVVDGRHAVNVDNTVNAKLCDGHGFLPCRRQQLLVREIIVFDNRIDNY